MATTAETAKPAGSEIWATLKPSKLTELRTLLGRMLALGYKAQFYLTFTKSVTFIYMFDEMSLQTKILCELINEMYFETFTMDVPMISVTTGRLKELYWFLGLNAPVVSLILTQAQRFAIGVELSKAPASVPSIPGFEFCKIRLRSTLSLFVCDHLIEGLLSNSLVSPVHKLIPRVVEEKRLLMRCKTNALEQLEAFNKNYYFMLPTPEYLSASLHPNAAYTSEEVRIPVKQFHHYDMQAAELMSAEEILAFAVPCRQFNSFIFASNRSNIHELSIFVDPIGEGMMEFSLVGRGLDKAFFIRAEATIITRDGLGTERLYFKETVAATQKAALADSDEEATDNKLPKPKRELGTSERPSSFKLRTKDDQDDPEGTHGYLQLGKRY